MVNAETPDFACEIVESEETSYVRFNVRGAVTMDNLMRLYSSLAGDYSGRDRFWDYRMADLTALTKEDLAVIAKFAAEYQAKSGGVKVAMVVARDVEFGITRQHGAVAESTYRALFGVFCEESEAVGWLERTA